MDRYIGQVLDDRYEIISSIGIGGMAYVYKAKCRRLSRFVAVKILKQEYADNIEFKRRFKNESNAVARLSHKNIVNIFDISHTEKIEYIVMEYIEGITLKEYLLKKGKLDWKQTLFFGSQIADALDHAHSRGIIHQDIKPHNIMLLRDGTLKVADFGIAKLENEGETKEIKEAIGSVHYVSPEQARGNTIDARTDVYSLGVVMYEMITGTTPYKGDTAISIVMQHINNTPKSPSLINPNMPPALEYVILKAMNSSLMIRYKKASEITVDIEKIKANPQIVLGDINAENDMHKTQVIKKDELKEALINSKKENSQQNNEQQNIDNAEDDDYYPPRKNGFIIFVALIVVMIIVFYAGKFALNQVFDIGNDPNNSTQTQLTRHTPPVVNLMYDDVLIIYDDYKFIVTEETYSTQPKGTIIKQSPQAGTELSISSSITLSVSLGEKTELMPNLIDYDYSQARIELTRLGISDISLEYDYTDDIGEGKVYGIVPDVGEDITTNTKVTLFVSAGQEIILEKVPNLKGFTVESATKSLNDVNLKLGTVTNEISESEEGTVIAQSVQSGTDVLSGSEVNIVIAEKAPEPVISTKSVTIIIPEDEEHLSIEIEVYVDNKLVYSREHSQYEGRFEIEIEGSGSAEVNTYANGILTQEQVVVFD